MDPQSEATAAAVFDFLCLYDEDEAAGRVRSLGEYLRRFPRHEVAIAEEFLRLRGGPDEQEPAASGAGPEGAEVEPERVGPYRLLEELGKGGQGSVWVAEDTRIRRTVALKLLAGAFVTDHRRARLRREAEALAALAHPSICPVLDADVEADPPWIAMPVLEGHDLGHALEAARAGGVEAGRGPTLLPRNRAELHGLLRFFEAAARAAHAAHEAGVVHRDLKPGNLFVHEEGRPVLLDFGLATDGSGLGEALTQSGDVFGTPAYMAPEQHDGRVGAVGPASDVFALGVTLHEALTGQRPFQGTSLVELQQAILHAPAPDPRQACPAAGDDLVAVLQVALDKEPARRYPTALALAEDLRRICDYEPVEARPAGPVLRLRRWARRNPGIASGLTATFLVLSIALAVTLDLLAEVRAALDLSRGRALVGRVAELVPDRPAAAVGLGLEALALAPGPAARSALLEPLLEDRLARTLRLPAGSKLLALLPVDLGPEGEAWVTLDRSGELRRNLPAGDSVPLGPLPEGFTVSPSTRLAACGTHLLVAEPTAGLAILELESGTLLHGPLLREARPCALRSLGPGACAVAGEDGTTVLLRPEAAQLDGEWPRGPEGPVELLGDAACLLVRGTGPEGELARLGLRSRDAASGVEGLVPEEREVLAARTAAAGILAGQPVWLDGEGTVRGLGAPADGGPLTGLAAQGGLALAWSGERALLGRPRAQGASGAPIPMDWVPVPLGGGAPREGSVGPQGDRAAVLLADGALLLLSARGALTGRARDFVRPAFLAWSLDGQEVIAASAFEMAFAYSARRPAGCFDVEGEGARVAAFAPDGSWAWILDGQGSLRVVETPGERGDGAAGVEPGAQRWARAVGGDQLALQADGTRALAWGAEGAWLVEAREGRVLAHWEGPLRAAALDDAGKTVALVDGEGRVRLELLEGGRTARAVTLPEPVDLARFEASGALVLAQREGSTAWRLDSSDAAATALAVPSLDGASGTRELLRLGPLVVLQGRDHHLRALGPDGRLAEEERRILRADWVRERGGVLLTGRRGPAASLRVMRAGQALRDADQPSTPHGASLASLDLAPDGGLALTADSAGGVALWSTSSGELQVFLEGAADPARAEGALAWLDPSPGPVRWLMARGERVSVVPADLEAVARQRPGRPLASWERGAFGLEAP